MPLITRPPQPGALRIRRRDLLGALSVCLPLVGCASRAAEAPSAAARAELSTEGRLRVAINLGNPILASRGDRPGDPQGVSVDLAREAGRRLGLPIEWVELPAAGQAVEAVRAGQVNLAFVAIDPVRGADLDYTAPYVTIEGAYLVRADSPLTRNEEVDRSGTRVVVGRGSAYDLYLTRALQQARLVRAPTSPAVVDQFLAEGQEVAAGVRQQLQADMARLAATGAPALRLLPGRFMVIEQAMAVPKGRLAAQAWLSAFIEEMKASGFVADSLRRHGIDGAAVAPPARP
ncbi:ABC transporter substrate-binding protein [Curvibacter lanceolatus]|uniref:ABC transporter substrate-binding protein n=1 Tax=Curvibacter lanceolatus TaxID=86182 RepID=UPI000381EDD5|nr:ABC transporter substrate-binding protein [Curvibacter lanceolatus]